MSGSVLHVVGPSSGGIRRHVGELASGLDANGWDVSVVAPAGVMGDAWPATAEVPVGLGASTPAAVRAVRRAAAGVDVVHAHGLTAGWIAVLAGRGSRLVVTVHNLVLDPAAGRAAPVLRALEGQLPNRARRTIVISQEMRDRFDPAGTDPRFVLIPPIGPVPRVGRSVGSVRDELEVPADAPLVVLVGRLHPQKDIGTLIDATARLDPAVRVRVIGEGPERGALETQIERSGLVGRVALVGSRPDAADYLAAADVVVMCSIWEGFGLVVAEALWLERPVVATAVGPVPEMVVDGQTGRLVAPGDPVALADAVTALLADPAGARALGRAGAKLVAPHFDHADLIRRTEAVYAL